MRVQITETSIKLWLSANDTYAWAHREGISWPCGAISGKRLFAKFDSTGLVDFALNGKPADVPSHELNAICADFLAQRLPKDHPAYHVVVGQFNTIV